MRQVLRRLCLGLAVQPDGFCLANEPLLLHLGRHLRLLVLDVGLHSPRLRLGLGLGDLLHSGPLHLHLRALQLGLGLHLQHLCLLFGFDAGGGQELFRLYQALLPVQLGHLLVAVLLDDRLLVVALQALKLKLGLPLDLAHLVLVLASGLLHRLPHGRGLLQALLQLLWQHHGRDRAVGKDHAGLRKLLVQRGEHAVGTVPSQRPDRLVGLRPHEEPDALVHGPRQQLVEVHGAQLVDEVRRVADHEGDDHVHADPDVVGRGALQHRRVIRARLLRHNVRDPVEGRLQGAPRRREADVPAEALHEAVAPRRDGKPPAGAGEGAAVGRYQHQWDLSALVLLGKPRDSLRDAGDILLHAARVDRLDRVALHGCPTAGRARRGAAGPRGGSFCRA
mmetsp:Transcript_77755/g.208656  ORF Transcript_77755/g.208656 Transcript_77755/m.208656 type:complete len:392 (+) Transcript_77755:228-1403(+)